MPAKTTNMLESLLEIRSAIIDDPVSTHMFDRHIYDILRYESDIAKQTLTDAINATFGYRIVNVSSQINNADDIERIVTEIMAIAYTHGFENPFAGIANQDISRTLRRELETHRNLRFKPISNVQLKTLFDPLSKAASSHSPHQRQDIALVFQGTIDSLLHLPGSHAVDLYDSLVSNARTSTARNAFYRSEFRSMLAAQELIRRFNFDFPEPEPAHIDEKPSTTNLLAHSLLRLFSES